MALYKYVYYYYYYYQGSRQEIVKFQDKVSSKLQDNYTTF